MLDAVGIQDAAIRIRGYPHEFSGGMRQRVMIAMALITKPDVLIADEPTTALDVTVQAQILELIKKEQQELGTAVILITHDLGVVSGFCDRINVMYGGKIVESGPTKEIFYNPPTPVQSRPSKLHPRAASKGQGTLHHPWHASGHVQAKRRMLIRTAVRTRHRPLHQQATRTAGYWEGAHHRLPACAGRKPQAVTDERRLPPD